MFNSTAKQLLLGLLKAKPAYLFALVSLNLGETALAIAGAFVLIPLFFWFNLGNRSVSSDYSQFLQYIWDLFATLFDYPLIVLLILGFLPIILQNSINYLTRVIEFKYVKDLVYLMQVRGIDSLGQTDFAYLRQIKPEDLLLKLNREINRSAIAIASVPQILTLGIANLIFIGFLIFLSWQLTLVTLTLTIVFLAFNTFLDFWSEKTRLTSAAKMEVSNRKIVDFLTKIRWFKTAANESLESESLARSIAEKNRAIVDAQAVLAAKKAFREAYKVVGILALVITSYYLAPQSLSEAVPVTTLYIIVLWRMLPFIARLDSVRRQFVQTRSSIETVANFLSKLDRLRPSSGNTIFTKLQTGIEFKEVTFAYPQQARIVLDKISFVIPRGKIAASICTDRLGKSIVADLALGFYDPIEGKILLDGIELRQYQLSSLRKATSIIDSNTFLFNDTIAYNFAYGLDNVRQTDLIDAAKKAKIYEFIDRLPQGWATRVGKSGITLSEVQKLKISIARAFLRDPEITIVCEPIENIDEQSVPEIIEILETCYRDRTTLIITQHPILTKKADRIFILNQGKIVEQGTPVELLHHGNIYRRLYATEFQTSHQTRQFNLARKIARKLGRQTTDYLSSEINSNFQELLDCLQSIEEGLLAGEEEQQQILDESYQSAKNMLRSLREYERKIARNLREF